MYEALFNFAKKYALWTLITVGISLTFGAVVNLIHWEFLTGFFSIIIHLINIFDFWVNVPLLITLVGVVIFMESAYWFFRGIYWVVEFFGGRD